jgi:glycine hydroxymethyltransferase
MNSYILDYLKSKPLETVSTSFLSYLTSLSLIAEESPEIASAIVKELIDQRTNLKLIASENYSSIASQSAMANLLTDKYAEGFPGHRFYAGCDNVDNIENRASQLACELFSAEHAYVQPHSGADANLIAFWAILHTRVAPKILARFGEGLKLQDLNYADWQTLRRELGNQRLLALDYYSGGHLTHGYRFNVSAQMFDVYSYAVDKSTGILDYDQVEAQAKEVKPLILLAGYSAYPRKIDFARMRKIADSVGAVFMVDMAHFAGLVAGKVFTGDFNPVLHADVVTTTTHKTLRGPRGGLVLCRKEFAEQVDKGCPLVIGGPLPHVIAAKAVAFKEALKSSFKEYSHKIVENSRALAQACLDLDVPVATSGTDNHIVLIDVRSFGLNGRQAEQAVREVGITLNRNSLPFDPNGPWFTSGMRLGTPAVTTLGMGVEEMKEIAHIIKTVLAATKPAIISKGADAGKPSKSKIVLPNEIVTQLRKKVKVLLDKYPLYPEIDLEYLTQSFLKNKSD